MTHPEHPSVAYLITASGAGGAERQVHDLALAMRARGWGVVAISMLPVEFAFDGLAEAGIPVHSLEMRAGIADPRALWRLRAVLRQHRPEVLHAHMVHANLLARASRLLVRTPVVIATIHNQYQGARWRSVAYRLTDRLNDLTTAVSRVATEDAERSGVAPPGRIEFVPNGVELAIYHTDPSARERLRTELGIGDGFAWLTASRLTDAKDLPTMVAAFRLVLGRAPDSRLLIAGTGPVEDYLRTAALEADLTGRLLLLGHRSDVPELMQAADGFLMSSAWEGLPMALLEAGASGLPIVATDVGGTSDAVLDGVSGRVVAPSDPAALAAAMQGVMSLSADGLRTMGEAGRDHVSRTFELGAIADRWDMIYRRLLER